MRVNVYIRLKGGVLDPEGETIKNSLQGLHFSEVQSVRAGKVFQLELSEEDPARARQRTEEMCRQLLANPVIEDYQIEIMEPPS